MRTKYEILEQVTELAIESPRSGIIPDLADALMIEVFLDIRDILDGLKGFIKEHLINTDKGY